MTEAVVPALSVSEVPVVPGWPLLGNLPAMTRGGIDFFAQAWRRHGDIFRVKAGPRQMVVLAHPRAIERVLASNRENYFKGPLYDQFRVLAGQGLVTLEGEDWRRRRRLAQPAFHKESIRSLVSGMAGPVRECLTRWREKLPEGGQLDVHQEMTHLTLNIVGDTLMGRRMFEDGERGDQAWGDAMELVSARSNQAVALPMWLPTPGNRRLKRAIALLDRQVYRVIATARAERAKEEAAGRPPAASTLLQMFLAARGADSGQALTDGELRDELMTFFLAGHETTALLMTWGLLLLAEHPAVVAAIRDEVAAVVGPGGQPQAEHLPRLTYTRMVVDEILRLRPPVWAVGRNCLGEDEIAGCRIRAGDVVVPMAWLTHRHPDFWEDPERFDPERFRPDRVRAREHWAYYPFSLGPRICIGNTFALMESQLILAMLLPVLDFRQVAGPPPRPLPQVTLRPDRPVPMRVDWR